LAKVLEHRFKVLAPFLLDKVLVMKIKEQHLLQLVVFLHKPAKAHRPLQLVQTRVQ
jgi:hypothetical protein